MTSQDTLPFRLSEKKPSPHSISLFLKYFAIIAFLILIVIIPLTLFFIKNQKDTLYQEKVSTGEILLSQLANRATLPLLENDILNLHGLIKEMKGARGIIYVAIVDNKKVIRAHTDPAKIGGPLIGPSPDPTPSEKQVLNLSKPITFMNQNVGWVVLGLSIDSISLEIQKENLSFIKKASLFCLMALLMGVGAAFLFSRWANPPISTTRLSSDVPGKSGRPSVKDSPVTRTQATILSAGIKEFKAYAESRDPQELLKDLNEYFSIATDGILEYGGYIDKISGDAVIGVFRNSPFQKNHTIRAIRCAMSIKKTLEQASQKGNQLLARAGFGISSGVVLSGPILSHEGRETAFIGESFKEASSLNMMAGPGEIIISKDVYQTIENLVSIEPLPPRETMQRTESWENFRLLHITERKDGG
jgi:class 3 adenylate cyclase